MTMTRDQLRAARMLLHLPQDALATLSSVGLATIRRFETGSGIREASLTNLRKALEKAGVVLLDGDAPPKEPIGLGVALKRKLPKDTQARILAEERREAERIEGERRRLETAEGESGERRRGRRPKRAHADAPERAPPPAPSDE